LCRAGVGTLTLIDRDVVELTNLQRQVLFGVKDVGVPKVEAAGERLRAIDPGIVVVEEAHDLTSANAERLLGLEIADPAPEHKLSAAPRVARRAPQVIIDGTDNFETRYLLNDVAVKHGLPLVYGGVIATRGMSGTFVPGGACLRCLFEDPPAPGSSETCDTAGVFGPSVAVVGAAQAADAIKMLAGKPDTLSRTLVNFDLWTNAIRRFPIGGARPGCPCCGLRNFEFLRGEAGDSLSLCGQDAIQISPQEKVNLDLIALHARLTRVAISPPVATRFMVRVRVEGPGGEVDMSIFVDGRAIILGTTSPQVARTVYARYVGS
jgi:adenylyltransferase/sulfurtransferase